MKWSQGIISLVLLIGIANAYPEDRSPQKEGRVVNGTNSDIKRYPFMVSLRSNQGIHFCGGSIISPYHVLTAAHCVLNNTANLYVQYARTEVSGNEINTIPVRKVYVHEKLDGFYNGNNWRIDNDIAVVELKGRLVYNYLTIAPVELPEQDFETNQTLEGSPGVLLGYGYENEVGTIQKHLQEVNLKIYSNEECQQRHQNNTNPEYHICGGVDEGGKGQCSYDSGGPLVLNGRVQVGIVSWSVRPCAIYPYPGVYVKVAKYINWIKSKMALSSFLK